MSGFRNLFIKACSPIGKLFPASLLLNITKQQFIAPFYHIISDENVPHVQHLYPVKGIKKFIQDLDFLLKLYEPIDYPAFQELVLHKKNVAKRSFLLTFDDGLKEFHEVIAPILIQKGIPAVCFLNSAFIDNKALFFRHKASLLIDYLSNKPQWIKDKKVTDWVSKNSVNTKGLFKFLLSVSYQNKACLDELANLLEYDFPEYLSVHKPYLTSTQILSLKNKGFHFGAHSIDHPHYYSIGLQEQIRQTKESIESICTRFSLDYKTFSFPFTDYKVPATFFDALYREHIADITFGCAGQKKELFPNHYQRISFEVDTLSAQEIHHSELIGFIFKSLIGKNTIKRK